MRIVSDKHRQWLMKELPLLENAGVLSPETSGEIRAYYETQTHSGVHWAIIACAVLGSLLIGSGIILLFAHNWDALSRPVRTALSLCPLAFSAAVSITALAKSGGTALREAAGLLHALAVGASIALIGQTYHLSGDTPAFLLTWALLVLPLTVLLNSIGAFLIYLALICGWSGAAQQEYGQAAAFWLLIIPPAAYLAHLIRISRAGIATSIALAGMLLSVCISTGIAFERTVPGLWIVAYSALLSGAGLLGLWLFGARGGFGNVPKLFGLLGTAVLTYIFTWSEMWQEIGWRHMRSDWQFQGWGAWLDGGVTLVFLVGWALLALKAFRRDSAEALTLAAFPVIATACFATGTLADNTSVLNALIFNAFMFLLGVVHVALGCRNARLRQLNGGMALLSLLLITRFFDTDFSYLARGLVFIVLGAVFLAVNIAMARRKKQEEVSA